MVELFGRRQDESTRRAGGGTRNRSQGHVAVHPRRHFGASCPAAAVKDAGIGMSGCFSGGAEEGAPPETVAQAANADDAKQQNERSRHASQVPHINRAHFLQRTWVDQLGCHQLITPRADIHFPLLCIAGAGDLNDDIVRVHVSPTHGGVALNAVARWELLHGGHDSRFTHKHKLHTGVVHARAKLVVLTQVAHARLEVQLQLHCQHWHQGTSAARDAQHPRRRVHGVSVTQRELVAGDDCLTKGLPAQPNQQVRAVRHVNEGDRGVSRCALTREGAFIAPRADEPL
mmetsp:Transcript_42100/g.75575  ORF Transcript_42100/g.75575 Transcript_42100/m.75575 type:complete len:287 (+) Transcript_42100:204-1064(+)